jgi:hypothetical protein
MTDKADHIAWAAEAVAVFQRHCRTGDEHAIADLICDLGHLAEDRGFDFLSEVRRGIGHWYAEHDAGDGDDLGPDAAAEIIIKPRSLRLGKVLKDCLIPWSDRCFLQCRIAACFFVQRNIMAAARAVELCKIRNRGNPNSPGRAATGRKEDESNNARKFRRSSEDGQD